MDLRRNVGRDVERNVGRNVGRNVVRIFLSPISLKIGSVVVQDKLNFRF